MKTLISLFAIVCSLFAAGCQSTGSAPVRMPPTELGADAATIVFIRPTSPPAAVKGDLSLDGFVLGKVFVRRYATILVTPGRHQIQFSFPFWVSVGSEHIEFECEPGKTYYLSYTSEMGVGAVYPASGSVVFSISPEMKLLSEEQAKPMLIRYAQAFTFGKKAAGQTLKTTPLPRSEN